MSFLAPLYVAGLLAVSLPIVFHLIRRTPRGQVPFSSLMFLTPSPPRITRRSRLNNVLLLLLRAAALSLLAFAFARPLWRSAESREIDRQPSRRVAFLIDRSASMQRGDLWPQAVARCRQQLARLTPADRAAVLAFDDRPETLIDWQTWQKTPPGQRPSLAEAKLQNLAPGWGGTNLGLAIVHAADLLLESPEGGAAEGAAADGVAAARGRPDDASREIVLVTDLQQGARVSDLQAYAWPHGVTLNVQIVRTGPGTNAGLHLAADAEDAETSGTAASAGSSNAKAIRCRISNEADSRRQQFTLQWQLPTGPIAALEPLSVHVPAGTSRVVRVPRPVAAATADRLVLAGDDDTFDDTLFVAPPHTVEVTVAYFGSDAADDTQGLRYYLERALIETARCKVQLVTVAADKPLEPAVATAMRLAIVAEPQPAGHVTQLSRFLAGGGTVLVPLVDGGATTLRPFCETSAPIIAEAAGSDFSLLGEVDYRHPLFAPFADPRFSDFTKIHFWKRRVLSLPAAADGKTADWKVIARFDGGDPAIVERGQGSGRLIVLASSWRPADSQLALSSKFVPLLAALLGRPEGDLAQSQFSVGDAALESMAAPSGSGNDAIASLPKAPGIYELAGRRVAVNVAADESRTTPLGVEELEQRGARLGGEAHREAYIARRRQLLVTELENRQKLWQWLIVAVLVLVAAETGLAGRIFHQSIPPEQPV